MNPEPQEPTEQKPEPRSAWPLSGIILVAVLIYVLSYAPVVRLMGGFRMYTGTDLLGNPATVKAPIHGDDLIVYKPVDWLIDETPLREPLMWWADSCGVGSPLRDAMTWRQRGTRSRNGPECR